MNKEIKQYIISTLIAFGIIGLIILLCIFYKILVALCLIMIALIALLGFVELIKWIKDQLYN